MLQQIWAVVACVLAFAMCVVVVYFLFTGGTTATDEEAREYFDAHGHWPDEA